MSEIKVDDVVIDPDGNRVTVEELHDNGFAVCRRESGARINWKASGLRHAKRTLHIAENPNQCCACPVCHESWGFGGPTYHCDALGREVNAVEVSPPDDCPARGDGVAVVYTIRARDFSWDDEEAEG